MRFITSIFVLIISLYNTLSIKASQFTLPNDAPILSVPTTTEQTANGTNADILKTSQPLSLKLIPSKRRYRLGEQMSLRVSSNTACYLSIVDFGTSGKATLLFPNGYQQNNLLSANRLLHIPNQHFKIKIGGKTGKEQLWALCRLDSTPPFGLRYDFRESIFLSLGKSSDLKARYFIPPSYDPQKEIWAGLLLKIR